MPVNYISDALLSQRLLREALWAGEDAYPSGKQYLVELEGLLSFVQAHNRIESFWPRLVSERRQQRDDALQEIRVARFLTTNGFPVVQWEPLGNGNLIGEFTVRALPSPSIFVEVKSPGWEAQLSKEQRDAGRGKDEKYKDHEGGADDPWRSIRRSVKKAYPKFRTGCPNLLVLADDRFVRLATWGKLGAEQALFIKSAVLDGEVGYFTSKEFENLGGVALFKEEFNVDVFHAGLPETPLRYDLLLYPNRMAREDTALPIRFIEAFVKA